jgi:ribonuclease E
LPEEAAVATKTEQIVAAVELEQTLAAVEPEQVATAAPAEVVSEPAPEPVVTAVPVAEPVALESNPVVVQVVADSAPEPAPIQGDLLEIVAQAGLELVETATAAPEVVAAPVARPPRPRRKRKAAPVIAEEPLAQVETGGSPN